MDAALTLRLTAAEQSAVLHLLADLRAQQPEEKNGEVRHLRVVVGGVKRMSAEEE